MRLALRLLALALALPVVSGLAIGTVTGVAHGLAPARGLTIEALARDPSPSVASQSTDRR